MTKYHKEKYTLLLDLKRETLNQLAAVQAEDAEQFLKTTDLCNKYIVSINALDIHAGLDTGNLTEEQRGILIEIARIRDAIEPLIPPLYEKLKQKSATEKKMNIVRNRYKLEGIPLPSVFMDKKI